MKIFREMKGLDDPDEEKKAASESDASDSVEHTGADSAQSETPVEPQVTDVIYVGPSDDAEDSTDIEGTD